MMRYDQQRFLEQLREIHIRIGGQTKYRDEIVCPLLLMSDGRLGC